jgi:hypothetical protein
VLACPTTSRKPLPPTNSAPEPSTLGSLIQPGRLRWLRGLPLVALWHATVSTVPRFHGQGEPPGQASQEGSTMPDAQVSFAGNLTDDPKVRYNEGGMAPRSAWPWCQPALTREETST